MKKFYSVVLFLFTSNCTTLWSSHLNHNIKGSNTNAMHNGISGIDDNTLSASGDDYKAFEEELWDCIAKYMPKVDMSQLSNKQNIVIEEEKKEENKTEKLKILTFVIGSTGVGKTTLINDLIGHTMEWGKNKHGKSVVVAKHNNRTSKISLGKIGHSLVDSATTVPGVYPNANRNHTWFYVDFPGFLSTKGQAKNVFNKKILQSFVEQSDRINKIIITIAEDQLGASSRSASFKDIIKELSALFNYMDEPQDEHQKFFPNLMWVFTKANVPKSYKTNPRGYFISIIKECKEHGKYSKKEHDLLDKILTYKENIFVYAPLCKKSRESIIRFIHDSDSFIPKTMFKKDFIDKDVDGLLKRMFEEFSKKYVSIQSKKRTFDIKKEIINDIQNRDINLKSIVFNKKKEESKLRNNIHDINTKISQLKKDIEALKNSDKDIVCYKTIKGNVSSTFLPDRTTLDYSDYPFEQIREKNIKGRGTLFVKKIFKTRGEYSAEFSLGMNLENAAKLTGYTIIGVGTVLGVVYVVVPAASAVLVGGALGTAGYLDAKAAARAPITRGWKHVVLDGKTIHVPPPNPNVAFFVGALLGFKGAFDASLTAIRGAGTALFYKLLGLGSLFGLYQGAIDIIGDYSSIELDFLVKRSSIKEKDLNWELLNKKIREGELKTLMFFIEEAIEADKNSNIDHFIKKSILDIENMKKELDSKINQCNEDHASFIFYTYQSLYDNKDHIASSICKFAEEYQLELLKKMKNAK